MISALLGSVIMSAVTVAMLLAININNKLLNNVGRYPLTEDEKRILKNAGYENPIDIETINKAIENLLLNE